MAFEITKLDPTQIEEDVPVITTELMYTKRVDFYTSSPTTGDIMYKGYATVGSLDSATAWRILRLTINIDGDVKEEYADGDANFDNIWNDRLSLTYI